MPVPIDLTLEQHLEGLRETRALLLERGLAFKQNLATKPDSESWSALEVLEHVLIVEGRVQEQVRRSSAKLDIAKRVGVAAFIKSKIFALIVRLQVRVKVPTKEILPIGKMSLEEVQQKFAELDADWENVLSQYNGSGLKLGVFKHPRFGWFSVRQTLDFLRGHTVHHLSQLERLTTAKATPLRPIQS